MPYTKTGPFTDNSSSPPISAAFLNGVETALTTANTLAIAPAPSGDTTGATDTTALQPLITAAQSTSGTLYLQAGTYYITGLTTTAGFNQPIIRGQGMRQTILTVVGTSAAFTLVGGSGQPSGGLITDMKITGASGTGTGIAFAGCNHARAERVWFASLTEGVEFYNRDAGSFTEFCLARDCSFDSTVTTPVRYRLGSGNESFHGSGVTGCVINQSATAVGPVIQVDAGCFPYGAPLTATIFARTTTPLIQNNDTAAARYSEFTGNLDIEILGSPASVTIGDTGTTNGILYAGTLTALGSPTLSYGSLIAVTKTFYQGGTQLFRQGQTTATAALSNSASGVNLFSLKDISAALVQVQIVASNYYYEYLLHVTRDKYSSSGWVATVSNPRSLNTAGYGAPTFAVANYYLTVTNTGYPASGVTALATRTPVAFNEVLN